MKKTLLIAFAAAALLASCADWADDEKEGGSTGPGGGDTPGGGSGAASMSEVCADYTCQVGCQGVNLFECKSDGQYYANEGGSYVPVNIEVFYGQFYDKYGAICGDGEMCSEPDSPKSSSSSGGYGGGGSFCSQHGCGGIFCSGDCIGCPGC